MWLRRRLGGLDGRENARAIAGIIVASAAMGIVVWFTQQTLESAIVGRGTLVRALRVFASIGAGMLILTAAARLLKIEEFSEALGRVTSRMTGGSPRG
jgi:peptidoglycan biosynthesis protein MviN/MurJ (putative lipid II flippase)